MIPIQFSEWRAEEALTEMGIKPGMEGLEDVKPTVC